MAGAEKGPGNVHHGEDIVQRKYLLAGVAGVVALASLGAGVLSAAAQPAGDGPRAAIWDGRGGHWHERGRMGPAFCGPNHDERIERMVGMVEGFANFSAEQQPAWERLRDSVRSASDRLETACDALRDSRDAAPPARLAALETVLSTGLEAVREVRPNFDALYAALNEKQKAALDLLIERRGRHR
jgi:hypothetical protein